MQRILPTLAGIGNSLVESGRAFSSLLQRVGKSKSRAKSRTILHGRQVTRARLCPIYRRSRTCIPAFSDSVSACPEKTERLVVYSPAELVPVVASVSRSPGAAVPAPDPVVSLAAPAAALAAATSRFLGVTVRSPAAHHATAPEAKLPCASTHAGLRSDQRPWSLLMHLRNLPWRSLRIICPASCRRRI